VEKMKNNNVKSQLIRVAAFGLSASMASTSITAFAADENVNGFNNDDTEVLADQSEITTDESKAEETAE
jgi:hypothetical protein